MKSTINNDQIFNSYDEAQSYSLTVPWKLTTCNVGEECWCRIILPTEKILYKNKVGDTERVDEFEYIIPDGSVDTETAEYIVTIHNQLINIYKNQKKRLEALQKLSDLDQELGFQ
jgi:hypothetical protein